MHRSFSRYPLRITYTRPNRIGDPTHGSARSYHDVKVGWPLPKDVVQYDFLLNAKGFQRFSFHLDHLKLEVARL